MAPSEKLVKNAPKSSANLMALLKDGLDWPFPDNFEPENVPLLEWKPSEIGLDEASIPRLKRIEQIPKLTDKQPFGVFILDFEKGRLPIGAIRRLVNRLVHKKRATKSPGHALWNLSDLIFFCQSDADDLQMLHVVAFRDTGSGPVMKVISWDSDDSGNKIQLTAGSLSKLQWPSSKVTSESWRDEWQQAFTAGYREGITTAKKLAEHMADVAKTVRDEVRKLLDIETESGPLRRLQSELKSKLISDIDDAKFADMYAQTMVYGLLTARISHPEDFKSEGLNAVLKFENPFLDSLYSSFRKTGDEAFDVDEFGLHDLSELLSRTNVEEILKQFADEDRNDDPVVFFYEDFLEHYDVIQRRELGTYYTPISVVRFMVNAVDSILKSEFKLTDGVADSTEWSEYANKHGISIPEGISPSDPVVRMLDPATGTGTFVLEWLRLAWKNLGSRADSGRKLKTISQVSALEISLSSYSVAHLKTSLEVPADIRANATPEIRLTDTLAMSGGVEASLFSEGAISAEGEAAERLKSAIHHSVVIGNPPYKDKSKGKGPAVEQRVDGRRPLLDDFTPSSDRGLGAHTKILRNLYVYFWRWALNHVHGTPQDRPGVVAFITSSAWLSGPVFETMRSWVRDGNQVDVIDLGGGVFDGPSGDENIFSQVTIPVAICIVTRSPLTSTPRLRFKALRGSRESKTDYLLTTSISEIEWSELETPPTAPIGVEKSEIWTDYPALGEVMPFHANGIHQQRTWVNDANREILLQRWAVLAKSKESDRPIIMKETRSRKVGSTGRDLETGQSLESVLSIRKDNAASIIRYSFRTLDRQWLLADSRVIDMPSPQLWSVRSNTQIFLSEYHGNSIGAGPSISLAPFIPNLHHFKGNGGGRVIPVFSDPEGTHFNIAPMFRERYSESMGVDLSCEAIVAYIVGVLTFPNFQSRFTQDLSQGGVRVPLTLDHKVFESLSKLGNQSTQLFTYGSRTLLGTRAVKSIRMKGGPRVSSDAKRPSQMPISGVFHEEARTLSLGDLVISDVRPDVWYYEITGMQVVKKWIGYRKASPSTKRSSPLNDIVTTDWPDEWTEELLDLLHVITQLRDLEPQHELLLDEVLSKPTLSNQLLIDCGVFPVHESARKPIVDNGGGVFE